MTLRQFVSPTLVLLLLLAVTSTQLVSAGGNNGRSSDKNGNSEKNGNSDKGNTDEEISGDIPDTPANKTLPAAALKSARNQKNGKEISQLLSTVKPTALNKNALIFWHGMAFKCEKRYEEAGLEFDKCADLSDVSPEGQLQVAETYLFLEQCDKAIKILNMTIKRKPYYECLELRGRSYLALNKTDLALKDFTAAAKIRPSKCRTLLARAADILRREHKPREALDILKAGDNIKERSTDATFYMATAACYEDLDQWNDAIIWCSKAIDLSKGKSQRSYEANQVIISRAVLERAKCYDRLGKRDLAKADRDFHRKYCSGIEDDILGK